MGSCRRLGSRASWCRSASSSSSRFGSGLGGEDAAHGGQGEGAEADGTLQGLEHIVTLIMGDECQQLLRLQFALDLLGEQAVEELHGDRPQFAEALPQEHDPLFGIAAG